MAGIFDYLNWRGDLDFSKAPFNPVDNIILSQFSYLPLDNIVAGPDNKEAISLRLAYGKFKNLLGNNKYNINSHIMFKEDPALFESLANSERFGDCRLFGFVNHFDASREVQFSALSILLPDNSCFVVFRGTDFSLVGWKEDFNMSFSEIIPAQVAALEYLEKIAHRTKGHLRLGGHSKGGNLAIFSAANCDKKIQKRITAIYANDSPGFHEKVVSGDGFTVIKDRIHSYVPQSSIIGMVLEHTWANNIIKSNKEGILQHELYSWEVTAADMVFVEKLSTSSLFVDQTLKQWITGLNQRDREKFINALFAILRASKAKSFVELEKNWIKAVGPMLKTLGDIDADTKNLLRKTIGDLFSTALNNMNTFGLVPKTPLKDLVRKKLSMEIEIDNKYEDYV